MIKIYDIINETSLKTKRGSTIARYNNNVGKQVGGHLYVHKLYAHEIIPSNILEKASNILKQTHPDFKYNTLRIDVKNKVIRFDEASDFDTNPQPHVGDYVEVDLKSNAAPRKGHSDSIWHHKWLWVKDDYKGFDVAQSKEWSRKWLEKFDEPAKGTDTTWSSQLKKYGLTEGKSLDKINHAIQSLEAEWERLDTQGTGHARQMEIQAELKKLWRQKEQWEKIYQTVNQATNVGLVYTNKPRMTENKELLMEARATPKMLEAFLREMITGTEWAGKVFLVGGFVRDELMGKEPKDADIVVGKFQGGVEFTNWLGKRLGIFKEGSNPVIYPTFGTANLRLDGVVWNGIDFSGESVDAVMFRKEQYHDPTSRKPSVQYTDDIAVDASRRDLTFNALYKDVATGKVIDPTGKGLEDLKNGIIRTPTNPTEIYTDDALRMFRAVRFATVLGFELSPEVVQGIKNNLHRLGNTSKERIRDELNKILISKNPTRGIQLLRDTGLLPYVAPELQNAVGMTQNAHHKHDVFDHTLEVLKNTKPELVQRLMALFHDIGKTATRSETPSGVHFYGHEDAGADIVERIMRDLKYPLDLINAVKLGVRSHMRLKHGKDEANISDKTLRKFKIDLGDHLENMLDVMHADNIAHADASAMPNQIERVRAKLKSLDVQVKKPNLPINGQDIMAMGVKPGPKVGEIIGAITDAWYENPNITREQAIEIVKRML